MKRNWITILTGSTLGLVVGAILWAFLYFTGEITHFIWQYIPSKYNFYFYPLVVCLIGGICIGLVQKKYGDYPKELDEVIAEYKANKTVKYSMLHIVALSSFLPLVFGGSVGPEAGLTGIIIGFCCYVNDRIMFVSRQDFNFKEIGFSDTFAVVFGAPLFGIVSPVDEDSDFKLNKNFKRTINLVSVLCALLAYILLKQMIGGGLEISRFGHIVVSTKEIVAFVPILFLGVILGIAFLSIGKIVRKSAKPLSKNKLLRAVIGAALLGLSGIFIPYSLFSGEMQLSDIQNNWSTMAVLTLIVVGFFKMIITEISFESGWRGGKIFPLIFSATSFGYALSILTHLNPVFCIAVLSATMLAVVLRKPAVVTVLLFLCFPLEAVLPILIAAAIGSIIPIPKMIAPHKKEAAN